MVVTLLTDFGLQDEYVGVIKGVILSIQPSAVIVDLCHQIPPGDVERAAWLLEWSWRHFPAGAVHVAVVDPGVGSDRRILCVPHRGHLFLAPDNGLLSWVLAGVRRPHAIWVKNSRFFLKPVSRTFHGRDIFAPVAARLCGGLDPSDLGPRVRSVRRLPVSRNGSGCAGRVIQFDRFGNAVTDLRWRDHGKGARGRWSVRVGGRHIAEIRTSYSSVPEGGALAVVGSRGLLEIAVNRGSAERKFGLEIGDRVEVVRIP